MAYRINRAGQDGVQVPPIVINKLATARGEDVKIALCALSLGYADPKEIADRLGISRQSVEMSFAFWMGAGLFVTDGELTAQTPQLPKRAPRLNSRQVVEHSKEDPDVALLVSESQNVLGKTLSSTESAALVTLYVQDKLPIDMILTVMSHFAARGKRDVRYLEKILLSWREEGICTGVDAERYLAVLEKREETEQQLASMMGLDRIAFTAGEKTLIARWFEEYGFDKEMVNAALVYAGEKRNVRYLNGILKKWYAAGYKKPQDIPTGGANLQPVGRGGTTVVGTTRSSARYKSGILVPSGEDKGV